jgi:hypothetical protein
MQVRLLPGSPSEGLPSGAVSRLENGWALALGFDSLSFRLNGGMAEWKGSALLPRERLGRSAGSNPAASAFRSDVVER